MKTASVSEIKKVLQELSQKELVDLCLRLIRLKTENKEVVAYTLFEEHDEAGYICKVNSFIEDEFGKINLNNKFFARKGIRRVGRLVVKYVKVSGSKKVGVELMIFFCRLMRESGYQFGPGSPLNNFYMIQIRRLNRAIEALHPDLQFDYRREMEGLDKFESGE